MGGLIYGLLSYPGEERSGVYLAFRGGGVETFGLDTEDFLGIFLVS